MKIRQYNRRQFLVGAGGFTLALPFLESIAIPSARAGSAPYAANPRFVCFTTDHGGVWVNNMFPHESKANNAHNVFSDHAVHWGDLQAEGSSGRRSLSPVLSASSDLLTDNIVSQLNVLRGVDIPFYIGHHIGGYLGNYAESMQGPPVESMATIDQVMAWSPSFYPDIDSVRARSIQVGSNISWGYSNPQAKAGTVQQIPGSRSSRDLFNQIFVPDAAPPPMGEEPPPEEPGNGRTPVVDRVIQHYRYLRDGTFGEARRLSTEDRRRLSDHMDRLSELQRRVNAVPASCGHIATPSDDARIDDIGWDSRDIGALRRYYRLYNEVIAAAFVCNTSRVATVHVSQAWSTDPREWHQEIAHKAHLRTNDAGNGLALAQDVMVAAQQAFFEDIYLDLLRRLDVEEANGVTYLDNSLVMWAQESGNTTHDADSLPVVTAGSAAGYFNVGRYYDFRNRDNRALADSPLVALGESGQVKRPGLLYNQWLATILRSMNVSPSEFEMNGRRGYGAHYVSDSSAWPNRVFDIASDPLPMMKRA